MRIYEAKMVEEGVRIRKRKRELMGYSILEKSDNIADIPCINNALRYGNLPFACAISTYACKSRRTPNLHLSKTRRSVVPRSILGIFPRWTAQYGSGIIIESWIESWFAYEETVEGEDRRENVSPVPWHTRDIGYQLGCICDRVTRESITRW